MTVAELIAKLQEMPQDADVRQPDARNYASEPIRIVRLYGEGETATVMIE